MGQRAPGYFTELSVKEGLGDKAEREAQGLRAHRACWGPRANCKVSVAGEGV